MPKVIPPTPDNDDQWFWDGVARDELLVRRCANCGARAHPPVPMCGDCHSLEWVTEASAGTGAIHSWIVSKHPTEPDDEPRIVILVELDDGIRLVSNLVDLDPAEVRNEMRVEVCFREIDGVKLPQFRPAASGRETSTAASGRETTGA